MAFISSQRRALVRAGRVPPADTSPGRAGRSGTRRFTREAVYFTAGKALKRQRPDYAARGSFWTAGREVSLGDRLVTWRYFGGIDDPEVRQPPRANLEVLCQWPVDRVGSGSCAWSGWRASAQAGALRRRLARWSGWRASAEGYLVGVGDVVGLDGSQAQPQALASLPQQLEGVGRGTLRGGALRISAVFLDEMSLQSGGDLVDRLQRVIDSPVSCCVVNHAASIPCPPGHGRGTERSHLSPGAAAPPGTAAAPSRPEPPAAGRAATAPMAHRAA